MHQSKATFVFIAFAIQIMQQEYIPQINTQSTEHVFVTTLSLTLYRDMRLINLFSKTWPY